MWREVLLFTNLYCLKNMTLKCRPTTSCGAALMIQKHLSIPVDRLAVLPSLTVFYSTHSSRDEQGEVNSCQVVPC